MLRRRQRAASGLLLLDSRKGLGLGSVILHRDDAFVPEPHYGRDLSWPVGAADLAWARDDDHGLLSAVPELQVALGEALLIPLAKRLHDLVSPVAVPLTRLSRVPHDITVEDFLDRTEVALTPSCQALPGDLGRVAAHVTSIRSDFDDRRPSHPGSAAAPLFRGALLVMWNSSSTVVPVLLVTGPIGVGKTAVLHEADALLIEAGTGHATVELEEIAGCWTDAMESTRASLVYQNLAALWSNFAAAGASRLLLSGLLEQRSELRRVSEAVPGAAVTVVRLYAPLSVLEQRIRLREPGSPEGEINGARWWAEHLDKVRPEDHLVDTADRPVDEIAHEVLRLAGWYS
jgi:predicted kinase